MDTNRTTQRVWVISATLCLTVFLFPNTVFAQSVDQLLLNQIDNVSELTTDDIIITDDYSSKGIRHIYAKRAVENLEVYNSYAAIHTNAGKNVRVDNTLHSFLSNSDISNTISIQPESILAEWAIREGVETESIKVVSTSSEANKLTTLEAPSIAYNNVIVKLKLYLLEKADLRYVWSIEIDEKQSGNWKNYFVDAQTGDIIHEDNWTVECNTGDEGHVLHDHNHNHNHNHGHHLNREVSETNKMPSSMTVDSSYNVFAFPVESPSHGSRTIEVKPWLENQLASPNGWHHMNGGDYTVTKGNNVDAYLDANSSNTPSGGNSDRANGGVNLDFDFAWDETTAPSNLPMPAITNLFYWNNVIHDIWYNYGFDEASGNFQEENNNGIGGNGSDYVQAEAQDGTGTCNANMSTPPDGSNPRMQMYLCNSRDGNFDNAVIVHEYGHGISNRLTGGPAASGCLGNEEQMGEGWSDWFGLMMTMEVGDNETDNRPIGTYLFNQGVDGPGIRPYPYTTDMSTNPMTYASSFSGVSVPHGLGSVWCTMLWDMSWMMVDEYGFDEDLYNGTGGNNMAMELVIEALKLQPCSPGFVDGRDAILAADEAINGGANVCKIWEVFANRGLGYSASQGSSSSRSDGTEAFDLPPNCTLELLKTTADTEVLPGGTITYTLSTTNLHTEDQTNLVVVDDLPENTTFLSASNFGIESGEDVIWPATNIGSDEEVSYILQVTVDSDMDPIVDDIFDNHETSSASANWEREYFGSTYWVRQSTTAYSGNKSWKAIDGSTAGSASLQYALHLGIGENSKLVFTHFYDTEESWDGGLVEISLDNGKSWIDLGDDFVTNGYNNTIFNSTPGFSGNSGGFITSEIDLSPYNGQLALVRFLMNCDRYVGGNGWYIDDVFIEGLNKYIPNIATATTDQFSVTGRLDTPTKLLVAPNTFQVTSSSTDVLCSNGTDGICTVIATGGSGSYTYAWSTGGNLNVKTGLASGTYYCDVSDGNHTRRKYFFISSPSAAVLDVTVTSAEGGANGSATVTSSGGQGPFTFNWSNGATGSFANGLAAGTYMVTATDGMSCEIVETFEVDDIAAVCTERSFILDVQLDQSPQEVSYNIIDENGVLVASRNFDGEGVGTFHRDIFCLSDGCYTLTIVDSFGDGLCASYSAPMGFVKFIDQNSGMELLNVCDITTETLEFCVAPLSATLDYVYPTCAGETNGSMSVTPSNGNYAYTYNWSNGETTATMNNLPATTYSVTVSDGTDEVMLSKTLIYESSRVFTAANDGLGSLRQVLDNGCSADTITFDPGLIGDTIFLTSEIFVNKTVHIEGMTVHGTYISGSNQNAIFEVGNSGVLSLETMRLLEGSAVTNGGAVYNQGELILKDLILDNNKENGIPRAISGTGNVLIKGVVKIK